MTRRTTSSGFTLIELSIVLVIIGLIVGGVLVGQGLISAAAVRAQISQIEKYNSAVNTFYGKYGYLPGDINATAAAQFGFTPRGTNPGQGDGNGVIEGNRINNPGTNSGQFETAGETVMFWVDLSTAGLIDGSFSTGSPTNVPGSAVTTTSTPNLDAFFPEAKLGQGNYVYVWSGGMLGDSRNYFGIEAIFSMGSAHCGGPNSGYIFPNYPTYGLTVQQAYSIDQKIDDGLPQSGAVSAFGLNCLPLWANYQTGGPYTTATPGSSTTCYDNGNVAGATQQYSLTQSGGANQNCMLSLRFQ